MDTLEEFFTNAGTSYLEMQLSQQSGLILLNGMNDSPYSPVIEAFSRALLSHDKQVIGLFDNSQWSPNEKAIRWPKEVQSILVSYKSGMNYSQEIDKLIGRKNICLIVDQIKDVETAQSIMEFAINGSVVITSVRGRDIFAAVDYMDQIGIPRERFKRALLAIIQLPIPHLNSDKYEILGFI